MWIRLMILCRHSGSTVSSNPLESCTISFEPHGNPTSVCWFYKIFPFYKWTKQIKRKIDSSKGRRAPRADFWAHICLLPTLWLPVFPALTTSLQHYLTVLWELIWYLLRTMPSSPQQTPGTQWDLDPSTPPLGVFMPALEPHRPHSNPGCATYQLGLVRSPNLFKSQLFIH